MDADVLHWQPVATVRRWDRSEDFEAGLEPDSVDSYEGNLLLNAGITRLGNLLVGAGGTAFNSTNSRIGVGDSSTAAAATQTDLQAATNKLWKLATASWTAQTGTWVATFGSTEGNFVWNEWGIDNGSVDAQTTVTAPMLNRKVASMGTKASGSSWQITVTVQVS